MVCFLVSSDLSGCPFLHIPSQRMSLERGWSELGCPYSSIRPYPVSQEKTELQELKYSIHMASGAGPEPGRSQSLQECQVMLQGNHGYSSQGSQTRPEIPRQEGRATWGTDHMVGQSPRQLRR
jgi:hypothetical protein